MAYRKNTIRKLAGPESRKAARLINNLESTLTKLKNLMPAIEFLELDSIVLYKRLSTYEKKAFQEEKNSRPLEQLPLTPEDIIDQETIDRLDQPPDNAISQTETKEEFPQ